MPDADANEQRSPLAAALAAVGDRWTLLVVEGLLDGAMRFNELQERTAGIAPEHPQRAGCAGSSSEGLVVAQPYSERPRRYVYELTASGRALAGALRLLADWGARHSEAEPVVHRACGTRARGALVLPELRRDGRGARRGGRALRVSRRLGQPRRGFPEARAYNAARPPTGGLLGEVAERLKAAAC